MRLAIDPVAKAHSYGSPRPFLLSHFSITVPYVELNREDRLILAQRRILRPVGELYRRLKKVQVLREQVGDRYAFHPDPKLQHGTETLYLAGYWQSWELVDAVATELRNDFRFREAPAGKDLEVLRQIEACGENAVSLHVRRGDYTLAAEGNIALPVDYYNAAIRHFQSLLAKPVFFVFSDDIAFTRENLPAGIAAVFVDHNDNASSHQDMRLMSACRHHIIANSSFSWWGAWLNPRPDKIVYAPKHWHLSAESYYPGLLPPDWVLADTLRARE